MKPIIKVSYLSKKYSIGKKQQYYTLRDAITNPLKSFKNKKEEFWALKDISFTVNKGEVLGVIGPNGAGKSTLLKILSRITPPTGGRVVMGGRVASLLEVGTGFHQELTGRENIYLNGAILGMSRKEINQKFDQIVDFAEIDKFLDTPIKHYSSGMKVKLAFSVASHLEPEILLVDEVLAVGDANFQKKSLGKMNEITKDQGRTIIFVSHNLKAIRDLCGHTILLSRGKIKYIDKTARVISKYQNIRSSKVKEINYKKNNGAAFLKRSVINNNDLISVTEDVSIDVSFRIVNKNTKMYLAFNVINQEGEKIIFWRDCEIDLKYLSDRKPGNYKYNILIPKNTLAPGDYLIEMALMSLEGNGKIHWPEKLLSFSIVDNNSIRQKMGFPGKALTSIPIKITEKVTS